MKAVAVELFFLGQGTLPIFLPFADLPTFIDLATLLLNVVRPM